MLISQGYLYGIQILALDILHECHFHHVLIVDGTDIGGHRFQPCHLRGTPAALSGNNLKPVCVHLSQGDGSNDTQFLDAVGQFLQRLGIKFATRLVGIGLNLADGYLVDGRRALRLHLFRGYQGIESSAQCVIFLVYCHFLKQLID